MMTSPASRTVFLCAGIIIFAALAIYLNSFSVPLLFDDGPAIVRNDSLDGLWPISRVLSPPPNGATVSGRPLLNFSFALNRAIGGLSPRGFHVANLTIHILAALCLFGIVRRTLLTPTLRVRFGSSATALAFAVAGLWEVHPLQTESVTYIAQRAESLAGLFYLLTLYGFIRGAEAGSAAYYGLSLAACLLGTFTKEVVVTAPLVVLLYDRTFVTGSILTSLRRRGRFYAGLAATWIILAWLIAGTGGRGGTVGFASQLPWSSYALTQCRAVIYYLWLCVYPRRLIFDYGTDIVGSASEVLPYIFVVFVLLGASAVAFLRGGAGGFLALCFFAILAPSSSVVPVASQTMAEHRVYLPLAAVVTGLVLGLYIILGRRAFLPYALAALLLSFLTVKRNEVYRSEISLWSDVVANRPGNARGHFNLALALGRAGDSKRALSEFQSTLQIDPRNAEVHVAFASLLAESGHLAEANIENEVASKLSPDSSAAHFSAANVFAQQNRMAEAITEYVETLRLRPAYSLAHTNLGNAYLNSGRTERAIEQYAEALHLEPTSYQAHYNFAVALQRTGRTEEAAEHYRQSLRLKPNYTDAHNNFGILLLEGRHFEEAISQFEEVVRSEPASAPAHAKLGDALRQSGRSAEALDHYRETLRLNPNQSDPHTNIGAILAQRDQIAEALPEFEAAVRLEPSNDRTHANLANALSYFGRIAEARRQCEEALRIDPKNVPAKELLEQLTARSAAAKR